MKLFLASSLDVTMSLFKDKISNSAKRVVFVANAADKLDDPWWLDLDRQGFKKYGFEVIEADLRELNTKEFDQKLNGADILHFCGGSVFYLLSLLNEKGLMDLIAESVKQNEIIFTGTSAGSIVAGKSLEIYKYDTEENKFYKSDDDSKGLGLVDLIIVPHCNNLEMVENNKNVVEHAHESQSPLLLLQDRQAIWVEDDKFEIVSIN